VFLILDGPVARVGLREFAELFLKDAELFEPALTAFVLLGGVCSL